MDQGLFLLKNLSGHMAPRADAKNPIQVSTRILQEEHGSPGWCPQNEYSCIVEVQARILLHCFDASVASVCVEQH